MTITPRKRRTMLNNCPVGLFLWRNTLVMMTEYSTIAREGAQRDAYIVESGEYFHGGAKSALERGRLLVTPCDVTV